MGHVDHRLGDDPALRVARQIADERAIDFQHVDLQRFQMAERRVACAEIVDRDAATERAHIVDEGRDLRHILYHRGFGDFDREARREIGAPAASVRSRAIQSPSWAVRLETLRDNTRRG